LPLPIRELCRHGNNGTRHGLAELPFGHRAQVGQYNAADFLRLVALGFTLELDLQPAFLFVPAEDALHLYHTVRRISVGLRQRFLAHKPSLLGECDHRRDAMVAALIGNDFELAIPVNTYAREAGTEIDSYRNRRSGRWGSPSAGSGRFLRGNVPFR